MFVDTAKSCCYETAVGWPVNMAGQRVTCAKCNNLLKSVETSSVPLVPDTDDQGLPTWKVEEGYGYLAVVYQKRMFHENKVSLDLECKGLREDALVDTAQLYIAAQNPTKWFEEGQEMILVKMDDGCDALMGKLKSRFVGKQAPTAWLQGLFASDETDFEQVG